MSFSWLQTDAVRDHFGAQLKRYAVNEPFDHLDVFWNPRAGAWQQFAAASWRIIEAGLATSEASLGYEPAVYDEITAQWAQMPIDVHQKAVWDPRKRRWVLAEPKPVPGGPRGGTGKTSAEIELERELTYLKSLLDDGKITPAQYQVAVQQTLSRYLNPPPPR